MLLYFYPIPPPYFLHSILLSCPALLLHSALLPYSQEYWFFHFLQQEYVATWPATTGPTRRGQHYRHSSLGPLHYSLQPWDAYYRAPTLQGFPTLQRLQPEFSLWTLLLVVLSHFHRPVADLWPDLSSTCDLQTAYIRRGSAIHLQSPQDRRVSERLTILHILPVFLLQDNLFK